MNPLQIKNIGRTVAAPIFTSYVSWILSDAASNGITTVYFLARDGYVLKKIADVLCKKYNLNIRCRYLYCSRFALRIPAFHLSGDEAYELLCSDGGSSTPSSIMKRIDLETETADAVIRSVGVQADKIMNNKELIEFRERLKNSTDFRTAADNKSKNAYSKIMEYFRQEDLFDQECVAIADSGWTGTMQRSISQLLYSGGFSGKILGYYFGLYSTPEGNDYGEYKTWYFGPKGNIRDKVLFCNNLLECMLSAPHGMTIGFSSKDGKVLPVLKEADQRIVEFATAHTEGILEYAESAEDISGDCSSDMKKSIHRIMTHPTPLEVDCYGKLPFCDDISENRMTYLAEKTQTPQLKSNMFINRFLNKLVFRDPKRTANLFWPYGNIAYINRIIQPWYRINIYLWEWLKYICSA